jgi:hypothetical protein
MRVPVMASAALILLSQAAAADGMVAPPAPRLTVSPWTYQFTPYGWVPWVSGDAVIKGRSFSVSETPIDVLEQLNMAWMSYQQAKNGPLTLFSDVIYASLGESDSFVRSKTFSPHVSGTIGAALSSDYRYWTVEAGGMYEIAKWRSGCCVADPDMSLEVLAGGRYWNQQLDVDLALTGTLTSTVSSSRAAAPSPDPHGRLGRSVHRRAAHAHAASGRGADVARRLRRLWRRQPVHLAAARQLYLLSRQPQRHRFRRLPWLQGAVGRL